jgi:alpha-1,2-mannosyltransferase
MTRDRIILIVLATIGGSLLLVVAVNRWTAPSDEYAFWLGGQRVLTGQPLYDPNATSVTPFAYHYPPVVAQVLAPVVAVLPQPAFSAVWTVLMLVCLWWLAGRDVLVALALCAFPPIAVEFWFRNVHLILAVLLVLGLRRWGGWFAVGAAIKLAPGLGLLYLAVQRRWREVAIAGGVGGALLLASVALSPEAWRQFIEYALARGPGDVSGFLPIPYVVRAGAGVVLAVVAARQSPRVGAPLFVVAAVLALPTLWFTALSTLVAVVPLLRAPDPQRTAAPV